MQGSGKDPGDDAKGLLVVAVRKGLTKKKVFGRGRPGGGETEKGVWTPRVVGRRRRETSCTAALSARKRTGSGKRKRDILSGRTACLKGEIS